MKEEPVDEIMQAITLRREKNSFQAWKMKVKQWKGEIEIEKEVERKQRKGNDTQGIPAATNDPCFGQFIAI